jgi:phage portal protein BeeE
MTQPASASWFSRFRRKPLARAQAQPIPFHSETKHVGIGPTNQPTADALLRESLGWSAIATRAIADRIASVQFVAYRAMRDGEEELVERTHPLARVLRTGSSLHGPLQTQRLVAQYLVTLGEAYLLKVRGRGLPVPVELWVMNAARVRPVASGGVIRSYVVTAGEGREVEIPAEDVVRAWWPDPENIYSGEGLLGPQATVVDTSKFADQTMRSHFEHNAMPRAVVQAVDGSTPSLDPDETNRINELWKQRFNRRSGEMRGLPAWLPAGFEIHELAALGGVTELVPILQHWRDQVLAGFGVPRSILGDVVDVNRAAAETNQYVFDTHTVKPIADVIAEALTLQLAVPDFGEELRVGYVEFSPADKDFELRRDESELRGKIRSVNQIRERQGEDPVPWGDLPVGTIGEVPYTGEEELVEPGQDDPSAFDAEPDGETSEDDEPRARSQRVRIDPAAEWKRVLARERRWQPAFRRAMLEVLTVQERAVQSAIAQAIQERSERAPDASELLRLIQATLAASRWAKLFTRKIERVRTTAYVATAGEALKLTGSSAAFQLTPETAARLRTNAETFRQLVTNTSIKRVSAAVSEAMAASVEAGESLSQRAKAIEQAVGKGFLTRRHEARTIARTETLKTTQAAQLDGFERSGVVESKQWNTSRDDAVRDSHEIDGQVVGLHDAFTLPSTGTSGAERADAPGVGEDGSLLSAANTINCRCFLTPVLEDA